MRGGGGGEKDEEMARENGVQRGREQSTRERGETETAQE